MFDKLKRFDVQNNNLKDCVVKRVVTVTDSGKDVVLSREKL